MNIKTKRTQIVWVLASITPLQLATGKNSIGTGEFPDGIASFEKKIYKRWAFLWKRASGRTFQFQKPFVPTPLKIVINGVDLSLGVWPRAIHQLTGRIIAAVYVRGMI